MNAAFYADNRQRFLDKLEENSVAFFYSGIAPVKSNDQNLHPYSVNRNIYYLTGIDEQNVWLVLTKNANGTTETSLSLQLTNLLSTYQWAIVGDAVELAKANLNIELNDYGKSIDLVTME